MEYVGFGDNVGKNEPNRMISIDRASNLFLMMMSECDIKFPG